MTESEIHFDHFDLDHLDHPPSPFRPCHRTPNEYRLKQRRPSAGRQLLVDSFLQNCETSEPQRMTSLEIAELTGKQHKDVLKAIRNMETAWEKYKGANFRSCRKPTICRTAARR